MYALAFGFAFYGSVFGELIWGISFYHYRLNGINPLWGYQGLEYTLAAMVALFFTVIFHFIMRWLYRHHYTLQQALPIMGGGAASHHPPLSPLHQSLRQL